MTMPRTTSKEEISALLEGRGALGAERLIEYNIFLTDGFGGPPSGSINFLDGPGIPSQIDGFSNDDSYRSSRRLLRNASTLSATVNAE